MNNFVKYVELILRLVWTGATFVNNFVKSVELILRLVWTGATFVALMLPNDFVVEFDSGCTSCRRCSRVSCASG